MNSIEIETVSGALRRVASVLKKRFPNLTVEEAVDLADEVLKAATAGLEMA